MDEATILFLNDAAQRLSVPKSQIVREAIAEYHARIGKLSEVERQRMLADFDRLVPRIPGRPSAEVDRELKEIRSGRRRGGKKLREGLHR